MRTRTAITLTAAALLLAACGSDASSTPAADDPAPTTGTATTGTAATGSSYDGDTIPAGTYTKTFTRAEVKRLGLTARDLDPGQMGPDGTGLVIYKFGETDWAEYSGPDLASVDIGSSGTHDYDHDGNLVFHEPCCGDSVLTWNLDGDVLTMKLIGPTIAVADPLAPLMRDGSYTRTQ